MIRHDAFSEVGGVVAPAARGMALLLVVVGLVSALVGCGSGHLSRAAPPPTSLLSCGSEIAGEEQLAARLVLVGEIHGTGEIPAAFGHLVCHAAEARRGKPILVGLEIPASGQSAVDAFLASSGEVSATQALLAQEFWQRDYQDGRSSQAMFDLLDELRRRRKAGLKIVVRALDPETYSSPSDRDGQMAASLADAIAAARPAQTLVLVGNVHSRTLNGYPWDLKASYVPLGALLRAKYDLIALDVSALGGSAWICKSAAVTSCGVQPLRTREPTGPTPRIGLDLAAASTKGYDGALFLGQVTASAPARLQIQGPRGAAGS